MAEPDEPGEPGEPGVPGRLLYLYLGSADVAADLAWWNEVLAAELLWRYQAFGADVAAVRLGPPEASGPAVVLADHRPVPSCLPIWAVDDLEAALQWAGIAGYTVRPRRIDLPDGPALVLTDRSGNQLALLRQDRPDALLQG